MVDTVCSCWISDGWFVQLAASPPAKEAEIQPNVFTYSSSISATAAFEVCSTIFTEKMHQVLMKAPDYNSNLDDTFINDQNVSKCALFFSLGVQITLVVWYASIWDHVGEQNYAPVRRLLNRLNRFKAHWLKELSGRVHCPSFIRWGMRLWHPTTLRHLECEKASCFLNCRSSHSRKGKVNVYILYIKVFRRTSAANRISCAKHFRYTYG